MVNAKSICLRMCALLLSIFIYANCARADESKRNFISADMDHINTLEHMHQEAFKTLRQGDYYKARRLYEDIVLSEPDDDTAYANLGHIHMAMGRTDDAQRCFEAAIHINPDNSVAQKGLFVLRNPGVNPDYDQILEDSQEI